jgi:type III secretion system FlhB-like substrate exporter
MQRAILPGQVARCIPQEFPAALVEILAFLYQFLARVDQVIRDFFSFAD